jgi:putative heme iron utilization protein
VKKFEQNTNEEILILDLFRTKFDSEMIDTLSKMKDFYIFEFTPFYGEAVFGFGKAYNLGGDNFEKFVQRQNTGHLSHGK